MRFRKTAAALAAAIMLSLPAAADAAGDTEKMMIAMERARDRASSYEKAGSYAFAYNDLAEYAELADSLADAGEISRKTADIAAGWRDQLRFSPEVYVTDASAEPVFAGSDGVFVNGADAVRLNVELGVTSVEDYLSMIPKTADELCVLVSLDVSSEKMLRDIAFGKRDDSVMAELRRISRIEGRVYVTFCPSVNLRKSTRTLAQSFRQAFIRVSELADRCAPNVGMVFTLGDVIYPGEDTVAQFYPGDAFVDVFGVELCHTYNKSYPASPSAAYDGRGEYYDPVYSVLRMVDELTSVSGKALPVMIAGCSFPWEGSAAVADWAWEMERFYRLIPAVCPGLIAVFYSNESTGSGICNLRQNAEARALYEECLAMPRYTESGASEITEGSVISGNTAEFMLYCGGVFSGAEWMMRLDGGDVSPDAVTLVPGRHTLTVYITDDRCLAKLEYAVTLTGSGRLSAVPTPADFDFNGNGIMDFGDAETLNAKVAMWDVDLNGFDPDVNGDGKVNIRDVAALRVMMALE